MQLAQATVFFHRTKGINSSISGYWRGSLHTKNSILIQSLKNPHPKKSFLNTLTIISHRAAWCNFQFLASRLYEASTLLYLLQQPQKIRLENDLCSSNLRHRHTTKTVRLYFFCGSLHRFLWYYVCPYFLALPKKNRCSTIQKVPLVDASVFSLFWSYFLVVFRGKRHFMKS